MTPLYKIPGLLLLPSSLLILLLLLVLFGPKALRRLSAGAALLLLLFASIGPLSSPLLQQQEASIPVPTLTSPPKFIVVLGNGHVSNPKLPLVSQFYYEALARITQGVVLAQQYPQASLVFTGYGGADPIPAATKAADLALSLGISDDRIYRFTEPRNTIEEAQAIAPLLTGRHTLLITSASHLPRAVAVFEQAGIVVTPYPTGHLVKSTGARDWYDWWPKASNWLVFESWVYEQLAGIRRLLVQP